MPVVSLVSAKGSPGVTTVAAALAAAAVCADEPALWVELDPSGGSGWIRARAACPGTEPTLPDVARDLRTGHPGLDWVNLAVEGPPGVPAVLAPSAARAASTVIGEGPRPWAHHLHSAGTVVVDCGRWDRTQPTAARIAGSDLVGVVCRSTLEGVEHVRHWLGEVRDSARCRVGVVVVGTGPYAGEQVAEAVGVPLLGVIEWRHADVGVLWARGASKPLVRSWLGRSAARTLASVAQATADRRGAAVVPVADRVQVVPEGFRRRRYERP